MPFSKIQIPKFSQLIYENSLYHRNEIFTVHSLKLKFDTLISGWLFSKFRFTSVHYIIITYIMVSYEFKTIDSRSFHGHALFITPLKRQFGTLPPLISCSLFRTFWEGRYRFLRNCVRNDWKNNNDNSRLAEKWKISM